MRLIHIPSLTLMEFDCGIPSYAILSHTWRGNNGDREVTFAGFQKVAAELIEARIDIWSFFNTHRYKDPYSDKLLGACQVALTLQLEYLWVDTCCIDKTKSAELSEAINSMFSWYESARICIVYLDDYVSGDKKFIDVDAFRHCRWFKRVWTLQELLAPQTVYFYDKHWVYLGDKFHLGALLSYITRIETDFLEKRVPIQTASVAKRMSWAAGRQSTREEDKAYSLLGIFNVNMPLLYGERSKSFIRLQEEILKEIDDHSIFAWKEVAWKEADCGSSEWDVSVCFNPRCQNETCTMSDWHVLNLAGRQIRGVFATSPDDFADSGNITSFPQAKAKKGHITITNRGIYMPSMRSSVSESGKEIPVLVLNCLDHGTYPIAIYLHHEAGDQYTRAWPHRTTHCSSLDRHEMYVLKTLSTFRSAAGNSLENSIILNRVSGPFNILQMPSGLATREQKTFFPTLSRVPYYNYLLVSHPDGGLVRIWFGTKLKQGKDREILPWCRGEPIIPEQSSWPPPQPPSMGPPPGMGPSPVAMGSPSSMAMQYGQLPPTVPEMIPSGAPQPLLPWPMEECDSEFRMGFPANTVLDIAIKQGGLDGYDVFNLEIDFQAELEDPSLYTRFQNFSVS